MTKAMKKISSYALMLTVFGTLTTPAQAASLVNNITNSNTGEEFHQEQVEKYDLKDDLLQETRSTITALNQASLVTEATIDDKNVYIYRDSSSNIAPPELYTETYSMRKAPIKRKVPESSLTLGLVVAAGIFATRERQRMKKA